MVEIVRPSSETPRAVGNINLGTAERAGAGLSAIGQAVASAGRQFQSIKISRGQSSNIGSIFNSIGKLASQESKKYFEQTRLAHQTGHLSNSMDEATNKFLEAQKQRYSQTQDKDGNPTFSTLVDDIGNIGKTIGEDVSSRIADKEVAARFKTDFNNYVGNQQVLALKKARGQQIEYSRGSLDKGLNTLTQQGSTDDINNMATYEQRGRDLLDAAVLGGVISNEDHQARTNKFSQDLRFATYQNLIQNDPAQAQELLANDAGTLGINEEYKANLDKTLEAKVKSDRIFAIKAEREANKELKNNQAILANDLEKRIEADALREDELLSQERNLPQETFNQLKTKFVTESVKKTKKEQDFTAISESLAIGEGATNHSPSRIAEHFDHLVESASVDLGEPLKLSQKAELASVYKAPVRTFAQEVNNSLLSGSPETAADAISAYTYIRDRKSPALNGNKFTNKAEAIAEYAELLVERANLSPVDAINRARENILNADDMIRKERSKEFNKMKSYKGEALRETTADDLDAENFFGFNKDVTDDTLITYRSLLEDAYATTGDIDAAKKMTKNQMDKTHGLSAFNGKDTYMFAPPEKLFPGIPVERMQQQLQGDIIPVLPEGVDPGMVQIYSDNLTKGNFIRGINPNTGEEVNQEIVSYGLKYTQVVAGVPIETPLINPNTGEVVRWIPDTESIQNQMRTEKLEAAQVKDQALRQAEMDRRQAEKNLRASVNVLTPPEE